jgi:hypothetical protein
MAMAAPLHVKVGFPPRDGRYRAVGGTLLVFVHVVPPEADVLVTASDGEGTVLYGAPIDNRPPYNRCFRVDRVPPKTWLQLLVRARHDEAPPVTVVRLIWCWGGGGYGPSLQIADPSDVSCSDPPVERTNPFTTTGFVDPKPPASQVSAWVVPVSKEEGTPDERQNTSGTPFDPLPDGCDWGFQFPNLTVGQRYVLHVSAVGAAPPPDEKVCTIVITG